MWIRFFLPLVFAGLRVGCSPSYNWRTVALAGGAVSTVLPGKPVTRARTLDFAGHNITLTFMLAQVNDGLFAVGYAPLPEPLRQNEALRDELGRPVLGSFYQGLHLPGPGELLELGRAACRESVRHSV